MGVRGGKHRIGTHRLRVRTRRGCGRLPVVHGHDVHAVECHAGSEGGTHHAEAVGGEAVRQHGQRVPHLQAGPRLLEQFECVAAERDRRGIGHRRAFDVEVEAVERVGVHDARIGLGQVRRAAAVSRIPLGEARTGGAAERDHHITTGGLKRPDRLIDRHCLLVGGVERQGRETRPARRAVGSGLDEAERDQRHAPRAGDLHQVWHRPHSHVHIRREIGLAPFLVAGVARVEPAGWKGGCRIGGWGRRGRRGRGGCRRR